MKIDENDPRVRAMSDRIMKTIQRLGMERGNPGAPPLSTSAPYVTSIVDAIVMELVGFDEPAPIL